MRQRLALAAFFMAAFTAGHAGPLRFEISAEARFASEVKPGRLYLILSQTNHPEPRFALGNAGRDGPQAFARDLPGFGPANAATIDETALGYPLRQLSALPSGDYFVQAVFDSNADLRSPNAPGNLFSETRRIQLDPAHESVIRIEMNGQVPPEQPPAETGELKFVKMQSPLLTAFHGRPLFLRAGILLPRDYERESGRRYPLWIRIGGLNTRYTAVTNLTETGSEFRNTWLGSRTPRFILVQLDGAGPLGDPYQINSANSGPFGDAVVRELIPLIENRFRAIGGGRARVLSGTSTGGWVALALQVFYPDCFNGAWASCPDPVDFRAFELVNIYDDENAYVDARGRERPSARDLKGAVTLTMRQEVGMENMLGRRDRYTTSGEQWGAWNAAFSPRGPDGAPAPIWDPQTGQIDRTVAESWKRYDLRLVLSQNWPELSATVRGKIHIASGEADQYFLNGAVHLLEASMARAPTPWAGSVVYGRGKPHGWSNLSVRKMLGEMQRAIRMP
jgi:hypothetical protein